MKRIIIILIISNLLCFFLFCNNGYVPASYFGLHVHRLVKKEPPHKERPWPSVPFKTWRLWDAGICWPEIQPYNSNEYNFSMLDKYVEMAIEHSVDIVINIGLSPKWAAKRPGDKSGYGENLTASEPKNINDWKKYVRTIAQRYKGKIKYWEIWNEPDMSMFFTGSPKKMVELVKEASKVLKEVDPDNKIISPSVTGYLILIPWLNSFLMAGGKDYIDIIGTHFYVWFKSHTPEKVVTTINTIKSYQKNNKIEDKPIWNTECGYRQENVDEELGAGYIARLSVLQWYYGVDRVMFYAWNNKKIIKMIENDEKPETINKIGIAFKEVQEWLIGSKIENIKKQSNIWIAELSRQNGAKAVMIWIAVNDSKRLKDFNTEKYKKGFNLRTLFHEDKKIPQNKIIKIGAVPVLLYEKNFFN
ncbi:MAG: hypothetical protein JXB50_04095 [Spirochaetes bacterium]|nr:hypothetical protein [Spirochaetota bacterium]